MLWQQSSKNTLWGDTPCNLWAEIVTLLFTLPVLFELISRLFLGSQVYALNHKYTAGASGGQDSCNLYEI